MTELSKLDTTYTRQGAGIKDYVEAKI